MQAKLTTGKIIELKQDCSCITHTGPHWLHMNDLWRERNRSLTGLGLYQEEIRRLDEKEQYMISLGIEEIIR